MSIPIGFKAGDVRSRLGQALLGSWAYADPLNEEIDCVNSDPQAVQVDTITVNTGTNDHEYVFGISASDITVSYTADSSTSTTEVAAGIAAAWNDSAGGDFAYATANSAVVTLTGNTPGLAYSIDTVDALTTLASVTAAAEADAVEFGRVVIKNSASFVTDSSQRSGVLCKSSKLAAQVDTLAVTYASGEVYYVSITIEGETYQVAVAADTDTATTQAAIVTAINAMMPANTVLAAGSSPNVTLTAEVAGKAFKTGIGLKSGTAARLTLTHTTATIYTDINRCILGVSLRYGFVESTAVGASTPSYPANGGVKLGRKGALWVASSQTISDGDAVYVETASGSNAGKLYNTTGSTRVLLTGARWERDERSTQSDGLAVVRLALGIPS